MFCNKFDTTCIISCKIFTIFDIDINEKNRNDGISPLHEAAKYNSVDVGRLLIESGCDVMIRDNHKKTPLHHAARRGREKIAEVKLPKWEVTLIYQRKKGIIFKYNEVIKYDRAWSNPILVQDFEGFVINFITSDCIWLPHNYAMLKELRDTGKCEY